MNPRLSLICIQSMRVLSRRQDALVFNSLHNYRPVSPQIGFQTKICFTEMSLDLIWLGCYPSYIGSILIYAFVYRFTK